MQEISCLARSRAAPYRIRCTGIVKGGLGVADKVSSRWRSAQLESENGKRAAFFGMNPTIVARLELAA
jgi:hypothetical protein